MAREPMPMPDMSGANMNADKPMQNLPPEAKKNLLKPDEDIGAMLVARLSAMSDQELAMLDDVITPDVAQVLMKLLPELADKKTTNVVQKVLDGKMCGNKIHRGF